MPTKSQGNNNATDTPKRIAELRDDSGHLTYVYDPLDACDLRNFGRVKTAAGNGNCGVESIIKGLRRSFFHQLKYDSALQ